MPPTPPGDATAPPLTIPASQARDNLGEYVTQVANGQGPVHLLHYDRPDGALVDLATATGLGLHLAGSHSVSDARRSWATVRRDANTRGPQALVVESQHIAVLLGQEHARYLTQPPPPLPGTSVSWDPVREYLVTDTGHKLTPGPYTVEGQIVVFTAYSEGRTW